jgi:hypothetical protein
VELRLLNKGLYYVHSLSTPLIDDVIVRVESALNLIRTRYVPPSDHAAKRFLSKVVAT